MRIFLHDTALRLVKPLEMSNDIEIAILSTQGRYVLEQDLIKTSNPFLKKTLFLDSTNLDTSSLDEDKLDLQIDILKEFNHTQLKVEQYMNRLNLEFYQVQFIFYKTLSFFYKQFQSGKIEGVLTVLPVHGHPFEVIPIDLALYFGKPVYTLDILYANTNGYSLWGVWDYHKSQYRKIANNHDRLKNYLFYSDERNPKVKGKALYAIRNQQLNLFQKIVQTIKNLSSSSNPEYKLTINSLMGKFPVIFFNWLLLTDRNIRINYRQHKKTFRIYQKLCSKPDLSKKFIYYPLHMDPEASTLVREVLSNQLTIIKWLSDYLPEGWRLLVKEHPAVFSLLDKKNLSESWYFYNSLTKYRSDTFYHELANTPKVEILSMDYHSEELIDKALAVATINGTVSIEAITSKTPVLLFGEKMIYPSYTGIYYIRSTADLIEALKNVGEKPLPDIDIGQISSYLFEMQKHVPIEKSELHDTDSEITGYLSRTLSRLFS